MLRFETAAAVSQEDAALVAQENGISALLASLLLQRGLRAQEDVQAFLHPSEEQLSDPFLLPDMRAAVSRIGRAVGAKERICVYGDYDCDGVCAAAILLTYLRSRGAQASAYLPSRHQEGYGMHEDAVLRLKEEGVTLIVTVDNGISAAREIALCAALHIDVVVTDHHECPETLPACAAVVNPHRRDGGVFAPLCGAGVALKLVQALGASREELRAYLPIAALATMADVVPLQGENRAIVAMGLPLVAGHPGLEELLAVSGSAGQAVTGETLAFRLAPRINAAGRMGDAMRALELLVTDEPAEAHRLALLLNGENEARQAEEQRILQEARRMLQDPEAARMRAVMLYAEGWNPGVIGIVASRLAEECYRPALLFSKEGDILTGSCRSIPGVHLYECLKAFEDRFLKFGGHAQAAGLTMEAAKFGEFRTAFDAYLRERYPSPVFVPTAFYERELPLSDVTPQAAAELTLLAPYGEGNPQPVFLAKDVRLQGISAIGREDAHLRATAVQGGARLNLIAFGHGRHLERYLRGEAWNLLYTPEVDAWQGKRRVKIQLRAIKPVTFFDDPALIARESLKFYDAFFRNILYNDSCGVRTEAVKDMGQAVLSALREDVEGTLVLCHSPKGALFLRESLLRGSLEDAAGVYWNMLPPSVGTENAVLLAPFYGGAPYPHARVFVYDGYSELAAHMPRQTGSVYLPETADAEALMAPLAVSHEEMGRIYRAFLVRLKRGGATRAELALTCGAAGKETAMMALLVFVELGFLKWDRDTDTVSAVPKTVPRSLFESRLYAAANKAAAE